MSNVESGEREREEKRKIDLKIIQLISMEEEGTEIFHFIIIEREKRRSASTESSRAMIWRRGNWQMNVMKLKYEDHREQREAAKKKREKVL